MQTIQHVAFSLWARAEVRNDTFKLAASSRLATHSTPCDHVASSRTFPDHVPIIRVLTSLTTAVAVCKPVCKRGQRGACNSIPEFCPRYKSDADRLRSSSCGQCVCVSLAQVTVLGAEFGVGLSLQAEQLPVAFLPPSNSPRRAMQDCYTPQHGLQGAVPATLPCKKGNLHAACKVNIRCLSSRPPSHMPSNTASLVLDLRFMSAHNDHTHPASEPAYPHAESCNRGRRRRHYRGALRRRRQRQ